jgi:hypothetical protein
MSFDYKRMLKFENNVGAKDKKIRLVSGAVLVVASLFSASVLMLLVGLVLIATSYFGWCPAYSGFGKNTLEADAAPAPEEPAADAEADTNSEGE